MAEHCLEALERRLARVECQVLQLTMLLAQAAAGTGGGPAPPDIPAPTWLRDELQGLWQAIEDLRSNTSAEGTEDGTEASHVTEPEAEG